jgi:hypothetical protein
MSMSTNDAIVFDDGAAYERYMGKWSRLVGGAFLDWLAPSAGLRWLDVGCGGIVAAYAWDMIGGGFPYESLRDEMRAMGISVPLPPSTDASRLDALHELLTNAGLASVETREITVRRTFADFEDYWTTILGGPSMGAKMRAMRAEDVEALKSRMKARLAADEDGRIGYNARANAVKGRVVLDRPLSTPWRHSVRGTR